MNEVHLSGYVSKDAAIAGNGKRKWARFKLAVEGVYDKEKRERKAEFIPVVFFVPADKAGALELIRKGSYVEVTRGRLEVRHFEGKTGEPVRYTEVVAEELTFPRPKKIKIPSSSELGFADGTEKHF